jgi:hypothetical protein
MATSAVASASAAAAGASTSAASVAAAAAAVAASNERSAGGDDDVDVDGERRHRHRHEGGGGARVGGMGARRPIELPVGHAQLEQGSLNPSLVQALAQLEQVGGSTSRTAEDRTTHAPCGEAVVRVSMEPCPDDGVVAP